MYYIFLIILLVLNNIQIQSINNENIIIENQKGEIGNYTYELWKDFGQTTMILKEDGKFSCSWDNIGNVLFRIGKRWDSGKTYKEIGNIKVNFEFDHESKGTTRLSIYGWTNNPLVEYYILENWEGYIPDSTSFGIISADGGSYDMYKVTIGEFDSPVIITQLLSIRNEKRNSGTVSVNKHFEAWEKYGFKMGKLFEVSLCVEGYKGNGNATISKNEIIIE